MILKRSLVTELSNTVGGVFTVLYTIVLAVGMVRVLSLASGGAIGNSEVLQMILYNSLTYIAPLLALSLFVAVLITMMRWWQDNEMVVWFSSGGRSLLSWISPVLRVTIPMVLLVSVLSVVISPWARSQSEIIRNQFQQQDDVDQLSTGRFIELQGGRRILFVESVDQSNNTVGKVFVADRSHDSDATLIAQSGAIRTNEEGDRYVILNDGRRYDIQKDSAETRVVDFKEYGLRMDVKIDNPWQSSKLAAQPMGLLMAEKSSRSLAEVFWRLCWPFAALNLALLAVPLSCNSPRAGRSLNLIFASLIFILYLNGITVMQNWVEQGRLHYLTALFTLNGLVFLITVGLYYRWVYCTRWIPCWLSMWYWRDRMRKEVP